VCNLCRSTWRRRLRRGPHDLADADRIDDGSQSRADQAEVMSGLRRLPRRQRECLVLRYYLDLTEAEIARALDISNGSVKTHTSRGLAALGELLGGQR
jgi:RNA polymerase sigma factor (sigma-70 family)